MLSVVATLKVKEDKIEAAKALFKDLTADTLANEKGTLEYQYYQKRDEPTTFVCLEKYEDDAAFAAHAKNLQSKGKAFAGILDGGFDVVMLEEI